MPTDHGGCPQPTVGGWRACPQDKAADHRGGPQATDSGWRACPQIMEGASLVPFFQASRQGHLLASSPISQGVALFNHAAARRNSKDLAEEGRLLTSVFRPCSFIRAEDQTFSATCACLNQTRQAQGGSEDLGLGPEWPSLDSPITPTPSNESYSSGPRVHT